MVLPVCPKSGSLKGHLQNTHKWWCASGHKKKNHWVSGGQTTDPGMMLCFYSGKCLVDVWERKLFPVGGVGGVGGVGVGGF